MKLINNYFIAILQKLYISECNWYRKASFYNKNVFIDINIHRIKTMNNGTLLEMHSPKSPPYPQPMSANSTLEFSGMFGYNCPQSISDGQTGLKYERVHTIITKNINKETLIIKLK